MLPHQPFPAPKRLKTSLKRRVYPRHHFIPRTTPRHCTSLQDRMLPGRKGTGTMALRKDDSLRIGVDLGGPKIETVTLARDGTEPHRHRIPHPPFEYIRPTRATPDGIQ